MSWGETVLLSAECMLRIMWHRGLRSNAPYAQGTARIDDWREERRA